jgi:hypothetical protein
VFKKTIVIIFTIVALFIVGSYLFYKKDNSIVISYTLNYENDSWQKNRTGFLWALSYLGAELPKGSFDKSIKWIDSTSFKLSFEKLGFNNDALIALEQLTDSIKQTEQYQTTGHIDLAQLVVLTIGSSWHYYAITGFPKNYQTYLREHNFINSNQFPITHSSVAKHHRLIKFNASDSVLKTVFVAEEGEGDLTAGNFKVQFHEVMDMMPNGQLRFAVYDENGYLASASPKKLGEAGKPAKCLWCHEIVFQPMFETTDSLANNMKPHEFQNLIEKQNNLLSEYRKNLNGEIDFKQTQDHTLMELLYISYMEPSIQKLSKEWGVSSEDIKILFKQEVTHQHYEFDFLKNVYHRKNIIRYTPYKFIEVANDVREPSIYEPNFIR